jgi:hypothetical protein
MDKIVFSAMDLIQIGLMLAACYGCYKAGVQRGVTDTLDFLESEGHIEFESEEK